MSQKVLVLYTGGTIGMQASASGFVPMPDFKTYCLAQLKSKAFTIAADIEFISLDKLIDSADLVPQNWTAIGRKLQQNWQQYCGFVVLHGTDTMAYTASALSFMFQGCDKPIVITGAQIPMSEPDSDGMSNLVNALALAVNGTLNEVCILFNGKVLRGNRSTKINSIELEAFDSPNFPQLGHVSDQVMLDRSKLLVSIKKAFVLPDFACDAVLILQLYPGISSIALAGVLSQNQIKAIVLKTYGMGNTPKVDSSLLTMIKQAKQLGIIVVNISQCMVGGVYQDTYATGKHLTDLGVVSGKDMTVEAAFAKLHFLLASGLSVDSVKENFTQSLAGEITK